MKMKCPVDILCEKIVADDICCISPFIAVISNPSGSFVLDSSASSELSYEFTCLEGSASLFTKSREMLLKKGQDLVLYPHVKVYRLVFSDDFRGYVMLTSREFCESIVTRDKYAVSSFYSRGICQDLSEEALSQYYHFFEWLKCAVRRCDADSEELIRQLLRTSFWLFSDYRQPEKRSVLCRSDIISQKFFTLLEQCSSANLTVSYFVETMKVPVRSLQRALRDTTGKSPNDHILAAKLSRTKNAIEQMSQDSSFSTITESLGFSSEAAFTRFFKTHTGMTPSCYRNLLK